MNMLQAFYRTYYSMAEYIEHGYHEKKLVVKFYCALKHSIDLVFNKAVQPAAGLPVGYI